MATLLLIIIYLGFIGLGIPDSAFGTAWPAIYSELSLPISFSNFFTVTLTVGTFISSLFSAGIINKFGTEKVAAVSTFLTAVGLLGVSISGNFIFMCFLAVPLGLGAGAIDSGLNNYVALHYSAKHMNFLHCFYGVGVSLSPYLISLVIGGSAGWRGGYRLVAVLQFFIAVVLVFSLPLWKKVNTVAVIEEETPITLPLKEILKIDGLPFIWCMFFAGCSIEAVCNCFGSTYLVEYKNISVESAAKIITFYFLGLAIGRFISGILSARFSEKNIILYGLATIVFAIMIVAFSQSSFSAGVGLFLIGFGVGPVYPGLMHLTPKIFGKNISQSIMGTQMAAASLSTMIMPVVFGFLAQKIGTVCFPYYIGLLFLFLCISAFFTFRKFAV